MPKAASIRAGSLVLIHGAGSGPWVFADWVEAFPEFEVRAVDLQDGLDVRHASMGDYVGIVARDAQELPRPIVLCGWSMGGLVALMAADAVHPDGIVLIEASAPGEVQGFTPNASLDQGSFDPEEAYGAFPAGIPARSESQLARAERKRGISVPSLPCPSLVVYGYEFAEDRGRRLAALYGSEQAAFPELDHWGLVRSSEVRSAIHRFLVERPNNVS
jgi:pimeloyl-ACP methyl ester carboxylesterase